MKKIGNFALWILFGFLAIIALGTLPSFAGFAAAVIALIIIPIKVWQAFLQRFIKGKTKAIVLTILTVLMFFTFPETDSGDSKNITNSTSPSSSITTTIEPTTTSTTETTLEQTTTTPTEASTAPTSSPEPIPTSPPTTEPAPPVTEPTPPATEPAPPATEPAPPATEPTPPATEPTPPATEPPHVHSFSAATCTAPGACSCGATDGSAIGHNFSGGTCTTCGTGDPNYISESMVWIPTKGGTKYHSSSSCSNMDNPEYVTKSDAYARGFTSACKKCH